MNTGTNPDFNEEHSLILFPRGRQIKRHLVGYFKVEVEF